MKRIILMAAVALLLVSCDNLNLNKKTTEATEVAVALAEPPSFDQSGDGVGEGKNGGRGNDAEDLETGKVTTTVQKIPAKIIKNANVQFQVKDVEASHGRISAMLKKHEAYYGSDNNSTSSYRIDNNSVIRVPSANFETVMEELMKESVYTNYKNITAEDVTAEFVDIEVRLKTKKDVEQRYIALLRQSNKVTDILEVEDKLRVIREEIEAAEGRLKLLRDQVGYSTITLNIYQKLDYTPEPEIGFFSNLSEAFIRGWRSLVDVFIVLVRIWPFLLLWIVAMIFIYRRFMKRK